MSKNNKNSNVKVTSNNYDVELKISNFKEKFNVKHKMNKKDKLEVSIKDKCKEYKLTLKETKNKIKVKQIKVIEDIKGEKKETLVSLDKIEYIDDFEIKVRDFYVPVTVLLNPVLELYYDAKKINTEMKANKARVSMKKGKYTVDCTVTKEDYMIETSVLSLDELKELYDENDDNKLGIYLEFLKRNHEQEDETVDVKNIEAVVIESKNEIDDLNNKYEKELKALQEKYEKEKEQLKKKINNKIKGEKSEENDYTLTDALCNVFEDYNKKELFIKLYDADTDNFDKAISRVVVSNNYLLAPVLKVLYNKLSNGTENEKYRANKIKSYIIDGQMDNKIRKQRNTKDLLNEAAKGTLDNYKLNTITRAMKFGEKIKAMSIKASSDDIYEVLASKDKYDAKYILPTVLDAMK